MQAYDLNQILKDISSPSNQDRQRGEAAIKEMRAHQAPTLLNDLGTVIV